MGDVVNPAGGFPSSARAERHVHADSRDAVASRGGNHPLSEQVSNENGGVALRAHAAHTYGMSEQVAVAASTLAEEALTAPAAFVDRVRDQRSAALESLTHTAQIDRGGVMTEAKRALLVDVRNAKLSLTCVLRRDGSDSGLYRQFVNGARRTRPLVWGLQSV